MIFSIHNQDPLCSLFNYSLSLGSFPNSWKEANITPIPKKGDLSLLTNHRPVSLLNAESKVFERLVFKHLFNHLKPRSCAQFAPVCKFAPRVQICTPGVFLAM